MGKAATVAVVLSVLCSVLCLSGCEQLFESLVQSAGEGIDPSKVYEATTATLDTDTWEYSNTVEGRVHEVPDTQYKVTITSTSSMANKTVYMVKTNASQTQVLDTNARYVESMAGFSPSASVLGSQTYRAAAAEDSITCGIEIPHERFTYFVPSKEFTEFDMAFLKSSHAARNASARAVSATEIPHAVKESAEIYIDTGDLNDLSEYKKSLATICAIGTHCNVWIVDAYYTSDASDNTGNKVNETIAEAYALKFDEMYPMITNVFGNESATLSDGTTALSTASPTREYVNIVLYDIGGDKEKGNVLGYFHPKDYSSTEEYSSSNVGKYFYIDSYFANTETDVTYSTLAHEFQHMIDYNAKNIMKNILPSIWWNEMMSMLCEDMMQEKLGIDDKDSPKGRLSSFNMYYPLVGLEYRTDNDWYKSLSYSTAYAFGCWLVRNYGGTSLIQKMSQSAYVDDDAILDALQACGYSIATMEDLLKLYTESLIYTDTALGMPSFNKTADVKIQYPSTGTAAYTYPLKAVNLWDSAFQWMVETVNKSYYPYNTQNGTGLYQNSNGIYTPITYMLGPIMYNCTAQIAIRPYGETLHQVGTINGSTNVTITLSKYGREGEHIYLMIQ
jgi:hypothetical protein